MTSNSASGIFRLSRPSHTLAFTGERMTREIGGQIEYEHLHRYCLARDLCEGLDVLDVASGEGYGSALLASLARSVIGVEIDKNSIEHAQESYQLENLKFIQGNALVLPLDNASVDVVVSFETLEHLRDHLNFINEIKRVLRPGGRFIVSTPDRAIYSAQHFNQFHMLELNESEFEAQLRFKFANVVLLRQRAILGSLITASEAIDEWRSYERRDPHHIEASNGLSRAPYLLGIASESDLPPIASSAYIDLRSPWEAADALARRPELERELDNAKSLATERERQRDDFRHALVDQRVLAADIERGRDELLQQRNQELTELRNKTVELELSNNKCIKKAELANNDHTRQLAALIRRDSSSGVPKELQRFFSILPGRRKNYGRLIKDYNIINSSALFDSSWYKRVNSDLVQTGIDPALHYLMFGAKEGRAPGPYFDGAKYQAANPDILSANVNPLIHYVTIGHKELRSLHE